MRILIATDAWKPQVNGVVRSLESVAKALREFGAEIEFLTPQGFASIPLPTYGEIKLALATAGAVRKRLEGASIDHIHIATEGPVGFAARRYCLRAKRAVHDELSHAVSGIYRGAHAPAGIHHIFGAAPLSQRRIRRMVSTSSIANDLQSRGFQRLMHWSRGVDHSTFAPSKASAVDLPRPIFLYAGRLAPEKNVESFLTLDLPGSKVIVGDGPSRRALETRLPQRPFRRLQEQRRPRRLLCIVGRVRVSEPHRHFRHGAS